MASLGKSAGKSSGSGAEGIASLADRLIGAA